VSIATDLGFGAQSAEGDSKPQAFKLELAIAPSSKDLEGISSRSRGLRGSDPIVVTEDSQAVLAALYTAHAKSIQRFLRDLLGDSTLAADGTQETFARAFQKLETIRAEETKVGWLFGIARNVSLEYIKARKTARNRFVEEEKGSAAPCRRHSPEAQLLGRESAQIVAKAMARLPEERRAALLMRMDHDLSYEEIATALGWSVAKARVEVFRAREILREALDSYEGDAQ